MSPKTNMVKEFGWECMHESLDNNQRAYFERVAKSNFTKAKIFFGQLQIFQTLESMKICPTLNFRSSWD